MNAIESVLQTGVDYSNEVWAHVRKMMQPRSFTSLFQRETWRSDVLSGFTVATVIIPNAMAYALLVGLPPQMGLYATLAGAAVSVLWGSSAFVITGAVGIVSLLTLTAVLPFAPFGSGAFITLAIALAILVGCIQFLAGLFQFGYLARLIPHSVIIGFSSAAAIIIASTQIPALLGISVPQKEHVIETLGGIITNMPNTHLPTLSIGILTLLFLMYMRRIFPLFPAALVALGAGVFAVIFFSIESLGVALVGDVPARLPILEIPTLSITTISTLISSAFIIALVGFLETSAIAKAFSQTTRERIDPDKELVGQGLANIASGFVGGLPVSGSFSASAVNVEAGARTALSACIASLSIIVALLSFAGILSLIPKVILAAIIVSAVLRMVSFEKLLDAYRLSPAGGVIAITTFVLAFIFKPDVAVIVGVVSSLVLLVHRIMFAGVTEVGLDHEWSDTLQSAGSKPSVRTLPGLLIVRADRSILYANSERIVAQCRELIEERKARSEMPKLFVMSFAGVNDVDFTGLGELGALFSELRKEGIRIGVIYAKKQEREKMANAQDVIGAVTFLHSIDELKAHYEQIVKG